jgi:hypothetical protein
MTFRVRSKAIAGPHGRFVSAGRDMTYLGAPAAKAALDLLPPTEGNMAGAASLAAFFNAIGGTRRPITECVANLHGSAPQNVLAALGMAFLTEYAIAARETVDDEIASDHQLERALGVCLALAELSPGLRAAAEAELKAAGRWPPPLARLAAADMATP